MPFKILFMGTPDFAVPILRAIHKSKHKIIEVYTQSPKKKNRGQKINLSPIHEYAKKINLAVRFPEILEKKEELEHIENTNPDVVVVVAYGKIIPSNFLKLKDILFINVHASLLPKWRGAAPIQRAIMNLDNETGISIMKIVPKLDAGPVLMKSKIKILKETNYELLSSQMSERAAKLILDALDKIEQNQAEFIEQSEDDATHAKKIDKSESKINWNDDAKKIIGKINALYPNPGSWFNLKGSRIKVVKAIEKKATGTPGEIIDSDFTVACLKNAIKILELKKEGKNKMPAIEFLKGNKLKIGTNISIDV
jgi:methionyl-tRNA formyltransferase